MQTALITGATSGLGLAFARALAKSGYHLVLVARTETRLAQVAAELSGPGRSVTWIAADLGDRAQLERVAAGLSDPDRPVDLLINNAGFGLGQGFLDSEVAAEEELLAVLCQAVLVLSHAAGRAMRCCGSGAILNVSSVAGFATMGSYSAAKAWVTSFSEGLATELAPSGVRVLALCPGFVRTEFHQRAEISMSGMPNIGWLKAEDVVRQALADLARGRVLSVPSIRFKVVSSLARHAPRSFVRWASAAIRMRRTP
jgi:uncharacterized protein